MRQWDLTHSIPHLILPNFLLLKLDYKLVQRLIHRRRTLSEGAFSKPLYSGGSPTVRTLSISSLSFFFSSRNLVIGDSLRRFLELSSSFFIIVNVHGKYMATRLIHDNFGRLWSWFMPMLPKLHGWYMAMEVVTDSWRFWPIWSLISYGCKSNLYTLIFVKSFKNAKMRFWKKWRFFTIHEIHFISI